MKSCGRGTRKGDNGWSVKKYNKKRRGHELRERERERERQRDREIDRETKTSLCVHGRSFGERGVQIMEI